MTYHFLSLYLFGCAKIFWWKILIGFYIRIESKFFNFNEIKRNGRVPSFYYWVDFFLRAWFFNFLPKSRNRVCHHQKKKMLLRDDQKTQRLCSNSGKTKMGIRSPNVYLKDLRWKAYRNIWCSDPWKKKKKKQNNKIDKIKNRSWIRFQEAVYRCFYHVPAM